MKTSGHTVLVTGGGSGIGFALAEKFHHEGNQVILVGRSEPTLVKASNMLAGAKTFVCDVAKASDRSRLVAEFPQISILINNAGARYPASFAEATEDDLLDELRVNLVGPVMLAQAYLPSLMRRAESAIINMTSGTALAPREGAAMYSASKAAMHSFTKSMRWQLESSGVRVFEVLPPVVRTALTAFQKNNNDMLTTAELTEEFWAGFKADRYEMLIGKVKLLHFLKRLSPGLADRLVRKIPGEE